MGKNYTPSNVAGGSQSQTTLNENFSNIEDALDRSLSRYADSPNSMESVLDMNNHRILNTPAPVTPTDVLRLKDLTTTGIVNITGLNQETNLTTLRARSLAEHVTGDVLHVKSHTTAGDGGDGYFRYITGAAPATYVDNDGTIIVPTGGDGSAAWLREFSGPINVKWFGATGDGTTDDATAIQAAIAAAKGGYVYVPLGRYRITENIDKGITDEIRLMGAAPCMASHSFIDAAYAYSSDFSASSIENSGTLGERFTTFICDGTNLIGAVDTASQNSNPFLLRHLSNICAYGINGAKIGIYVSPLDCLIENVHLALFEWWGLCIRGGITSTYKNISLVDNGWNLSHTGVVGNPNTYYSGCQIMLISNFTAADYTTITGDKPTTQYFRDVYMNVRGYQQQNFSGYRGIQASGLIGCSFHNCGSYTGHFFNVCTTEFSGLYVENYAYNGLTTSLVDPHCIYNFYSSLDLGTPVCVNLTRTTIDPFYIENNTASWASNFMSKSERSGFQTINGPLTSRLTAEVTVGTPGSAVTYSLFSNQFPVGIGFTGLLVGTNLQKTNYTHYAFAGFIGHQHTSASTYLLPASSAALFTSSTDTGVWDISITNIVFNASGGLDVTVNWGSSRGAAEVFILDIGLVGGWTEGS